jgi:ribonucleotide reductase beta subunit family protein with ferritin-like domain
MSEFTIDERLVLYPMRHKDLYKYYEELKSIWWFPNEINFSTDSISYNNLPENIQNQLKYILAFFAFGDELVMANINFNFQDMFKTPEVSLFYGLQNGNEAIHNEVYNNAINEICYSPNIIDLIRDDVLLKKIYDYVDYNIKNQKSEQKLIVLFIMLEGLLFSGSFAYIYWLDKKYPGKFPGLKLSNDFISRDENIHTMFGIKLLTYAKYRLKQDIIHDIFNNFINEIISQFSKNIIRDCAPDDLLTYDNLFLYYKFQADYLLTIMGYNKIYYVQNPFTFMSELALERRANHFQSQNNNYTMNPKLNLKSLVGFINKIK